MNTHPTRRLTDLLNQSTENIPPQTQQALLHARQRALVARHHITCNGNGTLSLRLSDLFSRHWVSTAIVIVALAAGTTGYWQHRQQHAAAHLDLAILTDDLPMEVFVDK